MTRNVLVVLCALAVAACASAASPKRHAAQPAPVTVPESNGGPLLWAGLKPGPLTVSFVAWDVRLQAADFPRAPQHLIQMNVWFPAMPGSGTAMTFRDYLAPQFMETHYAQPTDADRQAAADSFRNSLVSLGIPSTAADRWIDSPVYARSGGVMIPNKRYPIIGIAPDAGQTLPDQAILGEYLASYGYVVVSTPSITRFDPPFTPERFTALAEEQQDDLDQVVSQIAYWTIVVDLPVSIIGYGFGADAAVLYAMHWRQTTNALVLVDPQFSDADVAALKRSPMYIDGYRMPPVLELYTDTAQLSFVQSWNKESFTAQPLARLKHLHFTSLGFASAAFPEVAKATGAGPDIAADMRTAAESIRTFLERIWAPTRPPI